MKVTIAIQNSRDAEIFEEIFKDIEEEVSIYNGSLFDLRADAIVSPANSYGLMDGGLDLLIRDVVGFGTEKRVMDTIVKDYYGELHVGQALTVETNNIKFPYLISAPTMMVPLFVKETTNAYIATRAIIIEALNQDKISMIAMPMLCTGVGKMPIRQAATQMKMAWRSIFNDKKFKSFDHAYAKYNRLLDPNYIHPKSLN